MSRNLQPEQAVSAVRWFLAARTIDRAVAYTAAATMSPASTYWMISPMILNGLFALFEVLFHQFGELGRSQIGRIFSKRQHRVAAMIILAAAKCRLALHQMALTAHWAQYLLNAL